MMTNDLFCTSLNALCAPVGKHICVALSGGADSVCLLHNLYALRDTQEFTLSALHINHNLRGDEANRDEEFCRTLCNGLHVPLQVVQIDVEKARKPRESIETAARRLRYAVFETVHCDYLATAHTGEDALETCIINFLRGSGLKGLCGIPKSRGRLIRPLFAFSREDVLSYLQQKHLQYVTDSSNLTDAYTRNKIRHTVVPALKNLNKSAVPVAVRNFELLRQDSDYLEQQAALAYEQALDESKTCLNTQKICLLHPAIAARVVQRFCVSTAGFTPDKQHTDALLNLIKKGTGGYGLPCEFRAVLQGGRLQIHKNQPDMAPAFAVTSEIVPIEKYKDLCKINSLLLKDALDYDKIIGKIDIRVRKPGDCLKLSQSGVTKPLRRIQSERHIPVAARGVMPVAADDVGAVWAYQIGAAHRVAVDSQTVNVLIFSVNEN